MAERPFYLTAFTGNRTSGTDTDFSINFSGFTRTFKEVCLQDVVMANSMYNITDGTTSAPANNTIDFVENDGVDDFPATATIPMGSYNSTSIVSAVKTALEAVSPLTLTYTVSFSTLTSKITITASANTFSISSTGSANLLLGFSASTSTAQAITQTGTSSVRLNRYNMLNVLCSQVIGDTMATQTDNVVNMIGNIPIGTLAYGQVGDFPIYQPQWHQLIERPIVNLAIRILDQDLQPIDNNGQTISMRFAFR